MKNPCWSGDCQSVARLGCPLICYVEKIGISFTFEIFFAWQLRSGYVTAPPDAATFRVQLWLNAAAGWVAFDDVSVRLVDGVTKYYYFNGQRIAMRQDNSLTYLHSDHLGSVVAATDETGAVVNDNQPRYSAYGRERTASVNGLPTEYTFTGQP